MKPLCIDLFCGLGGWAEGFIQEGYRVIGFDVDPKFAAVYPGEFVLADVRTLDGQQFRDATVIVASPPCQAFSVARIGQNWIAPRVPRTEKAVQAMELVRHTVRVIEESGVPYVVENPRGMLRKLGLVPGPRRTITMCQYGARWMKPTDLWGLPYSASFHPPCRPKSSCHEAAHRGAKTGVQGVRSPALRAKIPLPLARAVARAFLPEVVA